MRVVFSAGFLARLQHCGRGQVAQAPDLAPQNYQVYRVLIFVLETVETKVQKQWVGGASPRAVGLKLRQHQN